MPIPYTLGGHASPTDDRDHDAAAYLPAEADDEALGDAPLDFRGYLQPVENQGQTPSCTGYALAGGFGYLEQVTPSVAAPYGRRVSAIDLYLGAPPLPQGGAYLRDALKAGMRGACLASTRPDVPGAPILDAARAEAERKFNKLAGFAAVPTTVRAMRVQMKWHGPLYARIDVNDGFVSPAPDGKVTPVGANHGGHAVLLAGNIPDKAAPGGGWWIVRNSWGVEWGTGGYCLIPWTYPITEAWALTQGLTAEGKPVVPQIDWLTALVRLLRGGV